MASWNEEIDGVVVRTSRHVEYIEVYLSGDEIAITFQVGRRQYGGVEEQKT